MWISRDNLTEGHFGNRNARVSRLDISNLVNGHGVGHVGDDGEDGDGDGIGRKLERGWLNGKAGIILVRLLFILPCKYQWTDGWH